MFGPVSKSQRMVLEDCAKYDTVQQDHLRGSCHLLIFIISWLRSPCELWTYSLEPPILCNEGQMRLFDQRLFLSTSFEIVTPQKMGPVSCRSWVWASTSSAVPE